MFSNTSLPASKAALRDFVGSGALCTGIYSVSTDVVQQGSVHNWQRLSLVVGGGTRLQRT